MESHQPFLSTLDPSSHFLNAEESVTDVLALARDRAIDTFKIFKWIFHEIKDIQLKQRANSNKRQIVKDEVKKMDNMQVSTTNGPWSNKEKAFIINCLKTTMEAFDNFKKDYEVRMATQKEKIAKIKESIKAVVKTSRGVIGAIVESFKNMICILEE